METTPIKNPETVSIIGFTALCPLSKAQKHRIVLTADAADGE
jgi:hypothetical protein